MQTNRNQQTIYNSLANKNLLVPFEKAVHVLLCPWFTTKRSTLHLIKFLLQLFATVRWCRCHWKVLLFVLNIFISYFRIFSLTHIQQRIFFKPENIYCLIGDNFWVIYTHCAVVFFFFCFLYRTNESKAKQCEFQLIHREWKRVSELNGTWEEMLLFF